MATTSLWRIKGHIGDVLIYAQNPEKVKSAEVLKVPEGLNPNSLEDVIAYAGRESATNQRSLVHGINCSPKTAREDMLTVKRKFEKCDGTIAYHGYQSFKQGEVTAEQAHQIGVELADRLWGDRYQVLVCTHVDKETHIHTHFIINTVSFVDGKKFYRSKDDYKAMREMSDRICREHGLSYIKRPKNKRENYGEWQAEKNGKPTHRSMIRADIDRAVKNSLTEQEFYEALDAMGYELKLYAKSGKLLERPSLRLKGDQRFYRFDRLGEGYELDELIYKVIANIRRELPFSEDEQNEVRIYRREHPLKTKAKGLQALYYYYCYELGIFKRYPEHRHMPYSIRRDINKLDRLDEQLRFLAANRIETIDELNSYRQTANEEIARLTAQRQELRNRLKRVQRSGTEAEELDVKKDISAHTEALTRLRKTLKFADEIEERSAQMQQELEELNRETIEKEELDELRSGRSRSGHADLTQRR